MRIFTVIGILFYSIALSIIGIAMIVLALNLLLPDDLTRFLVLVQSSMNSRIILGLSGFLLILVTYSFAKLILVGRLQRERTIAFTTSSGEVTIALSAVEDLIRRLGTVLPEIKELRPDVIANKKGIFVDLKVILRSEANIPDLTQRLQDITRSRIQEVLGVEEQIIIKIHVVKIISLEDKDKRKREQDKIEPTIPFGGYGRV